MRHLSGLVMIKLIIYQYLKRDGVVGVKFHLFESLYIKLLCFLMFLPSQLNLLILAMTDYPFARVKLTLTP